jgi:hypothetical protein
LTVCVRGRRSALLLGDPALEVRPGEGERHGAVLAHLPLDFGEVAGAERVEVGGGDLDRRVGAEGGPVDL